MIRTLLALPIHAYRALLGPLKPPCCRFVPTCSEYAVQALAGRGALRGCLLIAWRLLRCQPFSRPGYDPVPLPGAGRQRSRSSGGSS